MNEDIACIEFYKNHKTKIYQKYCILSSWELWLSA